MTNEPQAQAQCENTRLMLRVRDERDKAAFAQLFDFYAPRLKAMIMRGGGSAAQAEEIVQDALLAVWNKAHQFDPHRSAVSGWVYRIARNRQIDVARRENRPVPAEFEEEQTQADDQGHILSLEQEVTQLKEALAALPDAQRDLIERAFMGDLSHSEIQAETGLPLGTIKSRIRLGLDRLRHELKDLRGEETE